MANNRAILGPMLRALACTAIAAAVGAGLALTASGAPAARCQPTVSDTPGPFQQGGVNAPRRAKIGTGHVLQGRVVRAPDCAPVARALVVLWQAGPNGCRPNGRASVRTDSVGRFASRPCSGGLRPRIVHPHGRPPSEYEELMSRSTFVEARRPDASGLLPRCSSLRSEAARDLIALSVAWRSTSASSSPKSRAVPGERGLLQLSHARRADEGRGHAGSRRPRRAPFARSVSTGAVCYCRSGRGSASASR